MATTAEEMVREQNSGIEDFVKQQSFEKQAQALTGKNVGQFTKTAAYGSGHSIVTFRFVTSEAVKNSVLGEYVGKLTGEAPQTTQAKQSVGNIGQAVKGVGAGVNWLAEKAEPVVGKDITGVVTRFSDQAVSKLSPTKMMMTDSAVQLPIPNTLELSDGAQWAPIDADPSILGLLTKVMGNASDGDIANAVVGGLNSVVKEVGVGLMGLLDEGGSKGLGNAYLKSLENPFTDMAFQTMQRRQFRLTWQLFPKNDKEMEQIKKAIRMFRLHMHPSLNESTQGAWLDFPSMVIPEFTFNGAPSPFLPKIALSVINEVTVSPSPNGLWTTHTDGNPPHINLSIDISEVQPLLKDDIILGY